MSSDSPRVLHYIDALRLEAGGVVRSVIDLCNVLAVRGNRVTLASYDLHDVPEEWQSGGPNVPELLDLSGTDQADRRTIVKGYDVLHLHTPWDTRNPKFAKAARKLGVPYIVSVHGMLDDWSTSQKWVKKRLYWWLCARQLLEQAIAVHNTADGERLQTEKWYPRGKAVVLPLVVDMPNAESLPGDGPARDKYAFLQTGEPLLLFLSRVHHKKGIEVLLEAAQQLAERGIEPRYIIAGPGEAQYIDNLKQQAQQLGIANRVHFVGMVSGELKWSLYQACDLFVLPTQQENFGLVLPEALVCETPVITTTGVDIWPELKEAGSAIVPPRDAAQLADAIAERLQQRDRLADLGRQGREYVARWLDSNRVAAEFEELYRKSAAKK